MTGDLPARHQPQALPATKSRAAKGPLRLMTEGSLVLCTSSPMVPESTKLPPRVLNSTGSCGPARHQGHFKPGLGLQREISFFLPKPMGRMSSGSGVLWEAGRPAGVLLFQEHLLRCSGWSHLTAAKRRALKLQPQNKDAGTSASLCSPAAVTDTRAQFTLAGKKGNLL